MDIFGRLDPIFGGAFSADSTLMIFSGPNGIFQTGVGAITTDLNIRYRQNVTRLYELGSRLVFYVAGRCEGNISVGRVVGPRPMFAAIYALYGNVCLGGTNAIAFGGATGCSGNLTAGFIIGAFGVVLTDIGFSSSSQDPFMLIKEQMEFMFTVLRV